MTGNTDKKHLTHYLTILTINQADDFKISKHTGEIPAPGKINPAAVRKSFEIMTGFIANSHLIYAVLGSFIPPLFYIVGSQGEKKQRIHGCEMANILYMIEKEDYAREGVVILLIILEEL